MDVTTCQTSNQRKAVGPQWIGVRRATGASDSCWAPDENRRLIRFWPAMATPSDATKIESSAVAPARAAMGR